MTSEAPKEMTTMTDTSQESVERFSPYAVDGGCDAYGQMEQDDFGDWVRFEDYTALSARLAEAQMQLLAHLGQAHDAITRTPDDAQAALDALLRAERVKALREAAEIVRGLAPKIEHDSTQDDRMHESILERAARHIERAVE